MNEIQKELLKMLETFQQICTRLGLRYYLANGSALGAKKYCGFIPWDDDLDIAMPRKDYDLFCAQAQDFLPNNLFLQNYKTDTNFPLFYSKIRNSNTTFIENDVKKINMNHGIYIDIFPLDSYPKCYIDKINLHAKLKIYSWMQFCGFEGNSGFHKLILRKLGFHYKTAKTLKLMEKTIRNIDSSTNISCDYSDRQARGILSWDYYGEGTMLQFEHLSVRVPSKIDEYLTYKYGDWKAELPKELQVSHHNAIICDLNNSYLTYINSCQYNL